ncbi:MAG: DUF2339 domain-containing protein [Treponema sp.]|nr:DUF2339 domain-containing protein [Treponema sp.]
MKITENLRMIVKNQRELADGLETECEVFDKSDLALENSILKEQAQKINNDFETISAEAASLIDENKGLKNALYDHIFNEKTKIVNNTAEKLRIYFKMETENEKDKLSSIEDNIKTRIQNIKNAISNERQEIKEEFNAKLDEISLLLEKKVTSARTHAAGETAPFSKEELEQLETLKKEEISDEQVLAVTKKNNFERFVGVNVINVVGVFLLVIGVIAAFRFTYMNVSDLFKSIMFFSLGAIMLAVGEQLNRKKPNAFSLGISAGGIAIMYTALALSYFYLNVISMYPALLICVILTLGAFTLSVRYNSQVIASFSLIGGYMPMISMLNNMNVALMYGAMFYFVILNLLALSISWRRKWHVTAFIGLSFNIIGTVFLLMIASGSSIIYELEYSAKITYNIVNRIYVIFAFLIYTAIPIISTYHTKLKFKKSDIVLLAINTVFSSLIIYDIFEQSFFDFRGLIAVGFALVYIFLSVVIEKKFPKEERSIKILFFLTAISFVVLIIPMQFGRVWLSLGWLTQGIILAIYGIIKEEKKFKRAGLIISAMCLGVFLLFDLPLLRLHYLFIWKYTAITAGSLVILGVHIYRKLMTGLFIKIFKYFVIVNMWAFCFYIFNEWGQGIIKTFSIKDVLIREQIQYLVYASSITAAFVIAYVISRIKILGELGIKILSIALYGTGIILLFILNGYRTPVFTFSGVKPSLGIIITGTIILLILGVLSVLAIRDAMKIIILRQKKGIEWLPLVVSGYFIVLLSHNLVMQFNLNFTSAVISIIYVLTALAWIVYGFMKRFAFIRRFGLVLAVFSVMKLFIVDLYGLTQGYRIITYFTLGFTLVAISFVYQYFSKKLDVNKINN